MKTIYLYKTRIQGSLYLSLIILFLLDTTIAQAQTPANFTGNWELDKTRSKLNEPQASYPGSRILHINQNASMLIMSETYAQAGSEDFNTSKDTLKLDGQLKIRKVYDDTRKITCSWSGDKKTLIYLEVGTSGKNPSDSTRMSASFSLSEDLQSLTIERYGKNKLREIKSTEVYIKK
jgi:hypothetical protein